MTSDFLEYCIIGEYVPFLIDLVNISVYDSYFSTPSLINPLKLNLIILILYTIWIQLITNSNIIFPLDLSGFTLLFWGSKIRIPQGNSIFFVYILILLKWRKINKSFSLNYFSINIFIRIFHLLIIVHIAVLLKL